MTMKLESIYIKNFGKYHDYSLSFDESMSSFFWENGQGKTTLTAFISSMFYGMPKSTKDRDERLHYYPFNGGEFGGKLTFNHNGDTYLIARTFDKKSKAKDTLSFSKNGTPISIGEEEVGKWLFGIEEDAFLRLFTIDSNQMDFSQGSIATKLGSFAGDYDEDEINDALSALEKEEKSIKAKKGSGGELPLKEREILESKNRINDLRPSITKLQEDNDAYQETLKLIQELEEKEKRANEIQLMEERKKHLESLKQKLEESIKKKQDLLSQYPFGIPNEDEISTTQDLLAAIRIRSENTYFLKLEDQQELETLQHKFHGAPPSEDQLNDYNSQLKKMRENAAQVPSSFFREGEEDLFQHYEAAFLNEEKIENARMLLAQYEEALRAPRVAKPEIQPKKRNPLSVVLGILFGAISIVGIILLFFVLVAGIILSCLGMIGLLSLLIIHLLSKKKDDGAIIESEDDSQAHKIEELKSSVLSFTKSLSIEEDDPIKAMAIFESEYKSYQALNSGYSSYLELKNKVEEENQIIRNRLALLLEAYGIPTLDLEEGLKQLEKEVLSYRHHLSSQSSLLEQKKANEEEILAKRLALAEFKGRYHIEDDGLSSFLEKAKTDLKNLHLYEKTIEDATLDYKKQQEEYPLVDLEEEENLEEIQAKLSFAREHLESIKLSIEAHERDIEEMDELQRSILTLQEQVEALKHRHKILCASQAHLKAAQLAIKEQYVGPIKRGFAVFQAFLKHIKGLEIELDSKFNLTYKKDGEYRDASFLSDGEKTLVSLCLRLALLSNMYEQEDIFVILDDPFIYLDEPNVTQALPLLEALPKNIQLIYFTCHSSRKLR